MERPGTRKTVLIIEDDGFIQECLRELLELEGYRVLSAANGQEGLSALEGSEKPSLVLLDLMMPVKDGFQFRAEQRADPRFADLPVVVMSADGNPATHAGRLGASAYLKKPLDIGNVLETIGRFCR